MWPHWEDGQIKGTVVLYLLGDVSFRFNRERVRAENSPDVGVSLLIIVFTSVL